MSNTRANAENCAIGAGQLPQMIDALVSGGYRVIAPQEREGAVVLGELKSVAQLPAGWVDSQAPGRYELFHEGGEALFNYGVGPHSWKQFLYPPVQKLWTARRAVGGCDGRGDGFEIESSELEADRLAFFGVRPCDLQAIRVLDKVLMPPAAPDPGYKLRRERTLIIAVNCTRAGANCFCISMGQGPQAESGFDLALTEMVEDQSHRFLIEIGTNKGAEIMANVRHSQASEEDVTAARKLTANAASNMPRKVDTNGLRETLGRNYDSPEWAKIAERCMTCSNCTMVCPTCFCTTMEDVTDLTGNEAERWRKWDSCFTQDFSYIHGGSIRSSVASRYRQWLMHKLSTWVDQFGSFGCVGCGRCITWCPVGIDLTEVTRAIREPQVLEAVGAKNVEDN